MRRLRIIGLALAVVAALSLPAAAQVSIMGPGGVFYETRTSVTISNTTTATSMFSLTMPAGWVQSPLHLTLAGILSTNPSSGSVGNINVGCNYGTPSAASISLVNGLLLDPMHNASNVPIKLDFYVRSYQLVNQAQWVWGTIASATNTAATNTGFGLMGAAGNVATVADLTFQPAIACTWQWASAATTNSVTILNGTLSYSN